MLNVNLRVDMLNLNLKVDTLNVNSSTFAQEASMVQSNAKTKLSSKETTELQNRLENHKVSRPRLV